MQFIAQIALEPVRHDQFGEVIDKSQISTAEMREIFGSRMLAILSAAEYSADLMLEILDHAERAGITSQPWEIRQENPNVFVMDLIFENDRAYEWMALAQEWIVVDQIEDAEQLIDALHG